MVIVPTLLVRRSTGEDVAKLPFAPGQTAFELLHRANLGLRTRCLGSSICGLCWVVPGEGREALPPMAPDERALLSRTAAGVEGARLSCRLVLPAGLDSLELFVPLP